ncbi:MAG TPA: hypothetical protein VK805_12825 [Candidatus Baltobacteraceae bacterium]|jgi:hypothetical protein|nr:hypothetical protein [Candidatus Baltobacteraceae bacterium]
MRRTMSFFLLFLFTVTVFPPEPQTSSRLSAPTYYIAASAEYRAPDEILVKGASNLPAGAMLFVNIYDFIGEGSKSLSADSFPKVGQDGFFEVRLKPNPGNRFKHNLVCDIGFMTDFPSQDAAVLKAVGKHGENLGFPINPQAQVGSGERYSLRNPMHVP